MPHPPLPTQPILTGRGPWVQGTVLVILSVLCAALLQWARLPGALLLGPTVAGVIVAALGGALAIPVKPFLFSQALIGCLIARTVSLSMLGAMRADWLLLLVTVLAVIAASSAVGYVLARLRVLPGSTAIWGSSPGAATTMVLMADAYGADVRLVAFMQYLRVVMVTGIASLVSTFWVAHSGAPAHAMVWFPPVQWDAFAWTLLLAGAGAAVGRMVRVPAGAILVPMGVGALLHAFGGMTIELPPWLLTPGYALIGWSIGLRFNRPILRHAARAFPAIALATLVLIVACGGLAAILHWGVGIDPLTAYLATSPGGVDAVAIIAASANVDVSFVMAMQMARLLVVLAIGPTVARLIARRFPDPKPKA